MFDPDSRYAGVPTTTIEVLASNGSRRELRYVQRRFLPSPEAQLEFARHIVEAGDRLDNITARYLGEPTQFWRICDANRVLAPEELTNTPGQTIRILLTVR